MNNLKRILLTVVSALLLVVVSVAGTFAYLTNSTNPVTNTFTAGDSSFDEKDEDESAIAGGLDETDVDKYGDIDGEETRVTKNDYTLLPGHTYTKDPTVHIGNDCEDVWVFVKVVNPIAAIEDGNVEHTVTILTEEGEEETKTVKGTIKDQMEANGWVLIDEENGIYAHKDIAEADDDIVVFEGFAIKGDVTKETLKADYNPVDVVVTAYIVQADGFESDATTPGYQKAWDATFGKPTT